MGVLADIRYIPVPNLPKRRKPIKSKPYPQNKFDSLSDTEKRLVNLIDNEQLSFSVIAQSIGCKRQYVHQEYHRIIEKLTS